MKDASIDSLINAMLEQINLHKLELMQHYPNDLLVHDRAILSFLAVPGMQFGWVVGDRHTHIVAIGLHPEETDMLNGLTFLSNNDKFYFISIKKDEPNGFKLMNVTREEFTRPAALPCEYQRNGDNWSFTVSAKEKVIGSVQIDVAGNYSDRSYICQVFPRPDLSQLEVSALRVWANKGVSKAAGTLFCKGEIIWNDPENKQKLAA